jgi:hypothetical protein
MDLTFLERVYAVPGPVATVYLPAGRTDESGAHEVELRWRAAADGLREQGAPDTVIDALAGPATAPPDRGGQLTRVLVATGEGAVVLDEEVPGDLTGALTESATWGPLPDVLPLLRGRQEAMPYVLALVDRAGADIEVHGFRDEVERASVEGDTQYISKVNAGGWSQARYQRTAENLWEENAGEVAKEVDRLVEVTDARVVAVAGDVRACALLEEHLGASARERVVRLEAGARGEGAGRESLDAELAGHLQEAAARRVDGVLDEVAAGRSAGVTAEGLAAVCDALRKGQVDRLVLAADAELPQLWTGTDPLALGGSEQTVRDLGEAAPVEVPAVPALLRAAVGAGSGIVVLPAGTRVVREGVGALLRYSDASTPG